jgi:hypothetical protein
MFLHANMGKEMGFTLAHPRETGKLNLTGPDNFFGMEVRYDGLLLFPLQTRKTAIIMRMGSDAVAC